MKNQKGITITALVITIIVMLILSGVAIKATIKDDSLIKKANVSVDKYESSEEKEILNVAYSKTFMRSELKGEEITTSALKNEIAKNGKETIVEISDEYSNTLVVTFLETRNVYFVNAMTGNIEGSDRYQETISDKVFAEGDIIFTSTPNVFTSGNVKTTIKLKERCDLNNRSTIAMDKNASKERFMERV